MLRIAELLVDLFSEIINSELIVASVFEDKFTLIEKTEELSSLSHCRNRINYDLTGP